MTNAIQGALIIMSVYYMVAEFREGHTRNAAFWLFIFLVTIASKWS